MPQGKGKCGSSFYDTGVPKYTTSTPIPKPYDLRTALFGHGWIDLAPHRWDEDTQTLHSVLNIAGQGVDVQITAEKKTISIRAQSSSTLGRNGLSTLRTQVRRILALDIDLREFWSVCRKEPRLAWVPRRRAGYIMRSGEVFEDLMKLMFTTNCSWSATKSMTRNLVEALGTSAPSQDKAFPTAETCASKDEDFFRSTVRVGYRAKSCVALARGFAEGTLSSDNFESDSIDVAERRKRLLALSGFGPYAAGQALRTLGDFEDLALDSWCRAQITKLLGKKKPPDDKAITAMYKPFGKFQGLALWMDLTAEWHGEG